MHMCDLMQSHHHRYVNFQEIFFLSEEFKFLGTMLSQYAVDFGSC